MNARAVHFQPISFGPNPHRRAIVRPMCQRAGVLCHDDNASQLRHEVTCKSCLKRMTAREQA